ncbi:MAG TPA: hypothetical protein HPP97_14595 [Desulfuromonadales bacterium]|nr:hypothetical protein [Desulfuromonadales bacterium]
MKSLSPAEIQVQMNKIQEDFFSLYSTIQKNADTSGTVDDDLSVALAFARK